MPKTTVIVMASFAALVAFMPIGISAQETLFRFSEMPKSAVFLDRLNIAGVDRQTSQYSFWKDHTTGELIQCVAFGDRTQNPRCKTLSVISNNSGTQEITQKYDAAVFAKLLGVAYFLGGENPFEQEVFFFLLKNRAGIAITCRDITTKYSFTYTNDAGEDLRFPSDKSSHWERVCQILR